MSRNNSVLRREEDFKQRTSVKSLRQGRAWYVLETENAFMAGGSRGTGGREREDPQGVWEH